MSRSKAYYRVVYLTALVLIAALVVGEQQLLRTTIGHLSDDSHVINLAGRQRMLSQRISRQSLILATAMNASDAGQMRAAEKRLADDLSEWSQIHQGLISRNDDLGLSGENSQAVIDLFAELSPAYAAMCRDVEELLFRARASSETSFNAQENRDIALQIGTDSDRYLPLMNQVVALYESESSARVSFLHRSELWSVGIILLVLVIEALFLFEPMIRRLNLYLSQVEAAKKEAERANEVKSEFLANMSHEIRTPMAGLLGYVELLRESDLDSTQGQICIDSIERNGKHLQALINDILDLSKIEAGKMTVESINMNPARVVEEAVSLVRPQAIMKALTLHINYTTPIPEEIYSDPIRLRQILINLLSNAVKFTEEGSITVEVACDKVRGQVSYKVIDTGVGMTPEQLTLIRTFAPFTQADTSSTREFGGTGLGLRISNTLAKMLGGGLHIESQYGRGSSFEARVQTGLLDHATWLEPGAIGACLEKQPGKDAEAAPNAKPLNEVRILVVEDGIDNQRLIRHNLQKAGAYIRIAGNGRVALDMLKNTANANKPDLILMDMQMPVMDGYTLARRLRSEGYTVPIIALTAHALEGDAEKCIKAGCNDYMTKPMDFPKLLQLCARHIDWSNAA